jgi:hypothetical protein
VAWVQYIGTTISSLADCAPASVFFGQEPKWLEVPRSTSRGSMPPSTGAAPLLPLPVAWLLIPSLIIRLAFLVCSQDA